MKKILEKTLFGLCFVFSSSFAFAQSPDAVQMNTCELNKEEQIVRVSIKTTESFIAGANRYVLHIGGRHFFRNEHPEGRLNEIVFLLPVDDYETLEAQSKMVLVYGYYHENTLLDKEGNDSDDFIGLHWELGAFTPGEFKN